MSDPEKELKTIESMMFGGFIEPTPKNGIAWRVFEAVMGLRKQRDQWRECAERLGEALFYELSGTMTSRCAAHIALTEFYRLKEASK